MSYNLKSILLFSKFLKRVNQLGRFYSCEPQRCIGNTAIIAGGATGNGMQFTKALVENGVKNIVIGDIDKQAGEGLVKKLRETYKNCSVCYAHFDASRCEDIERLHECGLSTFGSVDVVVNATKAYDERKWSTMVDVNLKSRIAGSLLALQYMSKEKGGKGGTVVNVSSIFGLQPISGAPVYAGTMHAIIGFTRSLGKPFHYDKTGVRFMVLCSGMTKSTSKRVSKADNTPLLEQIKKEVKDLPVQEDCFLGLCLVEMLTRGENGSVWVTEDKEIYEIVIPNRLCFQRRC